MGKDIKELGDKNVLDHNRSMDLKDVSIFQFVQQRFVLEKFCVNFTLENSCSITITIIEQGWRMT